MKSLNFRLFPIILSITGIGCSFTSQMYAQSYQDPIWDYSQWISVIDAPVVKGQINGSNIRSADGASWFLSSLQNDKEVKNEPHNEC